MKVLYLILNGLKAVASLVGVSLTAASVAAELPIGWTIAAAVATAISVWAIPVLELGKEYPLPPEESGFSSGIKTPGH